MTNRPAARCTVLALMLLVASVRGQPSDRLAGTWVLDVGRSTFAGPPPKSQTTRLEALAGGIREIVERVNADGSTTRWDVTVKYDGRDYPVTGDPTRDTVAFTKLDDRTVDVVNKKGGTIVSRMRIVVAADGRSRTNTAVATDAAGRKAESVMFFDRQ